MNRTRLPMRYVFVMFTFTLALLLYIDRVCISYSKIEIASDLNLSDKQMGWIMSLFAIGYALGQLPAGGFIDKYGPRKVLSGIVGIWSVFIAASGAVWNFGSLAIMQFLFGGGEAGAFPGIARGVYSWIPAKERGTINGINFSGSRIGAALAVLILSAVISTLGWRFTFLLFGVIGLLWASIWYVWFRDMPEQHPWVSPEEKEFIKASRPKLSVSDESRLSIKKLFSSANVWLAMWQYMCSNFIFYFCLMWMLPMLRTRYNLTIQSAGFLAMMPFLAGALGNLVSGFLIDFLYKKSNLNLSRRLPAILGFSLVVVGLLMSMNQESPQILIMWFSVAIFGADMTLSPSWSFCIDIGKKNSGLVSSAMNMAGNIMSAISALIFPYIIAWTGSDQSFFYLAAFLNFLAIIAWLFMKSEKSQSYPLPSASSEGK
jgi:MFS transporter, ACS family, glucarate transporter